MNNQIPLDFYPTKARAQDPKTSHDAARSIDSKSIRAKILAELSLRDLATFQIAKNLGLDRDSVSPHMKPMERMGLVRRTEKLVKSPKGRNCEVWTKL